MAGEAKMNDEDPVLTGIRKRADEYREHSVANSAVDAADRAYLLDLLDAARQTMKLNGRGKGEYLIFFLGFITTDITELHDVSRDRLFAAVDRFLETMKGKSE
jgi:hypothetical protein